MGRPKLATVCRINDAECGPGRIRAGLCPRHYSRLQHHGSTALIDRSMRCRWCGDIFRTNQPTARYCGTICRDQERYYRNPNRRENRPRRPSTYTPRPGATINCRECGIRVTGAHGNRRYCSAACLSRVAERTRADRRIRPMHALSRSELADLHDWARILRGDPCCYCGSPTEALDHIAPVAAGGQQRWENLTAACTDCNQRKGVLPLLHYLIKKAG